MCEFSLNVVLIRSKNKPLMKHYFLMSSDPLMVYVAEKRAGGATGQHRYFEETKPGCH